MVIVICILSQWRTDKLLVLLTPTEVKQFFKALSIVSATLWYKYVGLSVVTFHFIYFNEVYFNELPSLVNNMPIFDLMWVFKHFYNLVNTRNGT